MSDFRTVMPTPKLLNSSAFVQTRTPSPSPRSPGKGFLFAINSSIVLGSKFITTSSADEERDNLVLDDNLLRL